MFRHASRKVMFVGDFVDRGPDQMDVLRIARSMCATGMRVPCSVIMNSMQKAAMASF